MATFDIAQFLAQYGGWGVTAILMIAVYVQWKTTNTILESRYKDSRQLVEKSVIQLTAAVEVCRRVVETNQKVLDVLQQLEKDADNA